VELRARNKRTDTTDPSSTMPVAEVTDRTEKDTPRHSITVRYDTLLYDTIQNMIRSSHTAQDFTYTSIADFIRVALRAYKDGMILTELDQNGPKTETSLRVDQDLWLFYKSQPPRLRAKILERAIRTFMKQQSISERD
jgi:uncharacterized protein (DUF4415 family)